MAQSATPRLHPGTVAAVREKADLLDVVSERVVLRKAGRDLKGLCPFHEDRNPSFYVSPGKQIYKCFSCGVSGDVFKFVMELDKSNFTDTVVELARRYGVNVRTVDTELGAEYTRKLSKRRQLGEITELAARFYTDALHSEGGRPALDYLIQRALNEKTIQQFRLGFAPGGWQSLYTYLVVQKCFAPALVQEAGLIISRSSGGGYYDRFRNRIIIPICDNKGQVIAFGGRAMGDEQPKYLNSPETELFDKGRTLFALDQAREAISRQDNAIVVEGYFDAISLHQAGITQVVATLGTSLHTEQVKQLLRYSESKRVVLNFDADSAGVQAAERAIGELRPLLAGAGLQLRVLNLPEGKDPDEYLKVHTPEDYLQIATAAPWWIDWQIERLFAERDLTSTADFQQVSQGLVELLSGPIDVLERERLVHEMAGRLSRGNGRLAVRLEGELRARTCAPRSSRVTPLVAKRDGPPVDARHRAQEQLLRIYLHCPEQREEIRQSLGEYDLEFSQPYHCRLWHEMTALSVEQDVHGFVATLGDAIGSDPQFENLLAGLLWPSEWERCALIRGGAICQAALATMRIERCELLCSRLGALCNEAEHAGDWEQLKGLMQSLEEERRLASELRKRTVLSRDR